MARSTRLAAWLVVGLGLAVAAPSCTLAPASRRRGHDIDPHAGSAPAPVLDLAALVDPFIGTDDSSSPHPVPGGAGGSTFPGPVAPFGMVQLSPDTPTASPSGYRFGDGQIEQFSVTHFNGSGCPNNEDLPFLPVVGALVESPGTNWASYRTGYDKQSERASPGYYRVDLDSGVRTELSATLRSGVVRFTFPATESAHVLFHPGRSATGDREGSLEVVAPDTLEGTAIGGGFCASSTAYPLHFVVAFDRPFADFGTWLGGASTSGSSKVHGTPAGGWVSFDTTAKRRVTMKIGLSYVSVASARANLAAENPGWDFEQVRARTRGAWNGVLNRVQVEGGSAVDRTALYTALYHVFQNPNVASDVSGEYLGFDGAVHVADAVRYRNFSGWDIMRSWTHLVSALAPEAPDIFRSLVEDGVESGLLPFWTHQNQETHIMVGDPGTVNVANAYAMGVRGFDAGAALALAKKSASDPEHTQRIRLAEWLAAHTTGNAAINLEYAAADFALAEFAARLGDSATHDELLARSSWWRDSWNPDHGHLEAKVPPQPEHAAAARIYELEVFGPASPDQNLAIGAGATASGACNADESAAKAVDGAWASSSEKWCDDVSTEKWLELDLGALHTLDRFVIRHAGAGGESSLFDTRAFEIALSADGVTFSDVVDVTTNSQDVSAHVVVPVDARYVRLSVSQPSQPAGDWLCQPFVPESECGFVEGNAAQYLWLVPHDLPGLFELLGGRQSAEQRLDALFTELNAGTARPFFYIGNEPEHGTPWVYAFLGAPAKTQATVRRIVDQVFGTGPGGLPGNDDLGATSAWLVWAYLGLYPVIPGTDVFVLHGVKFPSVTLQLPNGEALTLTRSGDSVSPYIEGVTLDGDASTKSWLHFARVAGGAKLDFRMGAAPSDWGTRPGDLPPAFGK